MEDTAAVVVDSIADPEADIVAVGDTAVAPVVDTAAVAVVPVVVAVDIGCSDPLVSLPLLFTKILSCMSIL